MIPPATRRQLHALLDEALDLLAGPAPEPPKRRRQHPPKIRVMPPDMNPASIEAAIRAGKKAGLL